MKPAQTVRFEDFYGQQLKQLGIAEFLDPQGHFILLQTHWFFGWLRRFSPKIIGVVYEKPVHLGTVIEGRFAVATTRRANAVRKLVKSIEDQFGIHCEVNTSLVTDEIRP